MTSETPATKSAPPESGIRKKNLIVIGLIFAAIWALAVASGSYIVMGVAGFLTLIALVFAFWAWRQVRRHNALAGVMQRAGDSPEARKHALATLAADKNSKDPTNVIARAQLLASEEPSQALAMLEPIEIKSVPANMQDDFALLKSQLLLSFGRAKQARPLVDWVNLDNPQRKEMRPMMAAIVGETWARTGAAKEANDLLNSIDPVEAAGDAVTLLLIARVFTSFAVGKKGLTRSGLDQLVAMDPNLLGRFLAPQAQVHPGLQRLAREAFERGGPRRQQKSQGVGRRR